MAIAIPVFSSQLEKSREATDAANERSAKAAAVTAYLTDESTGTYYFNAATGKLMDSKNNITGYGKGTDAGTISDDNNGKVIQVVVDANGEATITWVAAS